MATYSFDAFSLAIAVSKHELKGLIDGTQTAVLKNTRTPYGGAKCYLYETKADGGRGQFVAIGTLDHATFYKDDGVMCQDCGITPEEAVEKISSKRTSGSGIAFYIKDIAEVDDPDMLSRDIRLQFLIDPPKTVTTLKK